MQDLNTNSSSTTASPLSSSSATAGQANLTSTSSSIITGKTYIDHVYSFSGQSYDATAESTLKSLNELSTSERLCLQSRQIANRDVRILLPSKHDAQNYETFLFNFNKLALACYLKVLRASGRVWSTYDIEKEQDSSTNYSNINVASLSREEERHLRSAINDDEFIKTYLDQVINAHNQVVNKLYLALNNNQNSTRVHFKAFEAHKVDFSSKKVGDTHLFRTFRVIGLRKQKNHILKTSSRRHGMSHHNHHHHQHQHHTPRNHHHHNHKNSSQHQQSKGLANFLLQNDFNEVVDIRASFDIRQFQNRSGYDCFIECEFNYFRIYHHMCNHMHHNWNSNEFNSASIQDMYNFPLYQHQQQQQYQRSPFTNHYPPPPPPIPQKPSRYIPTTNLNQQEDKNASRKKAERLIANHLYNHTTNANSNKQPALNFTNLMSNSMMGGSGSFSQSYVSQPPVHNNNNNNSNHQASMRVTFNRANMNDVYVSGANQYQDRNSSFYFTRNRDDSM